MNSAHPVLVSADGCKQADLTPRDRRVEIAGSTAEITAQFAQDMMLSLTHLSRLITGSAQISRSSSVRQPRAQSITPSEGKASSASSAASTPSPSFTLSGSSSPSSPSADRAAELREHLCAVRGRALSGQQGERTSKDPSGPARPSTAPTKEEKA